jgi:hypothetical protein
VLGFWKDCFLGDGVLVFCFLGDRVLGFFWMVCLLGDGVLGFWRDCFLANRVLVFSLASPPNAATVYDVV